MILFLIKYYGTPWDFLDNYTNGVVTKAPLYNLGTLSTCKNNFVILGSSHSFPCISRDQFSLRDVCVCVCVPKCWMKFNSNLLIYDVCKAAD